MSARRTGEALIIGRAFRMKDAAFKPFLVTGVTGELAVAVDFDGQRTTIPVAIILDGLKAGLLVESTATWDLLRWKR